MSTVHVSDIAEPDASGQEKVICTSEDISYKPLNISVVSDSFCAMDDIQETGMDVKETNAADDISIAECVTLPIEAGSSGNFQEELSNTATVSESTIFTTAKDGELATWPMQLLPLNTCQSDSSGRFIMLSTAKHDGSQLWNAVCIKNTSYHM